MTGMTPFVPNLVQRTVSMTIVLVVLWILFRFFEWRSLYYPTRAIVVTPETAGVAFEDVVFFAEDGKELHGWWIPVDAAHTTLVVCHGNAGNISDRVELAADLHRLGVNVFLFDYRGYGRSRGIPTETGMFRDARAAYEVARARHAGDQSHRIAVLGRSLGAGVAVQLALDKPVVALVLENAFSSVPDMARHLYPWLPRFLCRYRYDSASKIAALKMPKLIAHSRSDEIVPFELGRKLYNAAADPKTFVELQGGHNDATWQTTPGYLATLQAFLRAAADAHPRGTEPAPGQ